MAEYIHSGIAGKINRIVKPHIGNILVTSDFGNAKESTLTEDVLKAAVNDINRIKYAVTYKGEKATVDALPTTGNTQGDMWNVTENGHNYAWTGSEWDDLGGTVVGGGNSEWEWAQSYVQTLDSASSTDWDAPWYSGISIQGIPSTGTDYLMIIIKVPQNGTFLSNNTYAIFSGDHPKNSPYITIAAPSITQQEQASTKTLTFLLTKEHGLYLVKAFKANNNVPTERIYSQSLYPIPQTLNHAYLYGHDLPSGSTIETYIPSTLIIN